eukprot:2041918-Rhodomonas_salina.2
MGMARWSSSHSKSDSQPATRDTTARASWCNFPTESGLRLVRSQRRGPRRFQGAVSAVKSKAINPVLQRSACQAARV